MYKVLTKERFMEKMKISNEFITKDELQEYKMKYIYIDKTTNNNFLDVNYKPIQLFSEQQIQNERDKHGLCDTDTADSPNTSKQ